MLIFWNQAGFTFPSFLFSLSLSLSLSLSHTHTHTHTHTNTHTYSCTGFFNAWRWTSNWHNINWFYCHFENLLITMVGMFLVLHSYNCPHGKVGVFWRVTYFFQKKKIYSFLLWYADPAEELCQEEKILYKLISGLHSSISIHIASDYLLDEATNLV